MSKVPIFPLAIFAGGTPFKKKRKKKKNGLGIFRGRLNKGNVGNEALDRHTGYVGRALRTQAWNPGTGEDT